MQSRTHLVNCLAQHDQLFDLGHPAQVVDDRRDRVACRQSQPRVPLVKQPVKDLGDGFAGRAEL